MNRRVRNLREATRRIWVLAVVTLPVSAQQPVRLSANETSLGARAAEVVQHTLVMSAALRLAYVVKTASGEAVVLDGVRRRTYTAIPRVRLTEAGGTPPIKFSPDGRRTAYVALKNAHHVVVVDGIEGPAFDRIAIGAPVFSPDSRRVAYFAERAGKSILVIDGVEGPAYDDMNQQFPEFTSDSKRVVYSATRARQSYAVVDRDAVDSAEFVMDPVLSDSGGRRAYIVKQKDVWSVIVDGIEGKPYRSIGNNLVFSRDGRRFLYQADDSLSYVVVDDVQGPGFGSIKENSYAFSPDGAHVAFVALQESGLMSWVLDGVNGTAYDWVSTEPAFSPDGRRLTYVAERDRKRFVVIGGREGEPFDDVSEFPRFSADGRVLYVAKRSGRVFVGVDANTSGFDEVAQSFITAGGRLVVVARRGTRWHAIVDGIDGKPYEEAIWTFAVSPDEGRIAYVANRDSMEFMVVDGIEGKPYDDVANLRFSADGRHTIFSAKRLGQYVVVVDGVESATYDEILYFPPADTASSALGFLARRGRVDLRIDLQWSR